MKIGLIREGKTPQDRRVALTPTQCIEAKKKFPNIEIVVQKSDIRCYNDSEYTLKGVEVTEDVSSCDILLGIKEVPINQLIDNKTYLFFSHTIKMQPYNKDLLRAILEKNIRLVDYEVLKNEEGKRVIAFGRFAGIVGAYNGMLGYGKRYNLFDLKRAVDCEDLQEVNQELKKVKLPSIKIGVTGNGRVAWGAMEVLESIGIKKVAVDEILNKNFDEPVYAQIKTKDYNKHKEDKDFNLKHFYKNPKEYEGNFKRFSKVLDLFVAAAYWDPEAPVLFSKEDAKNEDFKIRVIADVTCDIEGSVASTLKPSTIDSPFYDYNPDSQKVEKAFSSENNITVMAVDNLPNEVPKDASASFGKEMVDQVFPNLLGDDSFGMIKNATIASKGDLTPEFEYLRDYVEG